MQRENQEKLFLNACRVRRLIVNKINELFKKVCDLLGLSEDEFMDKLPAFFDVLSTDQRFLMLENGLWDLKVKHSVKVVVDNEDEDEDDTRGNLISVEDDDEEEERPRKKLTKKKSLFKDAQNSVKPRAKSLLRKIR